MRRRRLCSGRVGWRCWFANDRSFGDLSDRRLFRGLDCSRTQVQRMHDECLDLVTVSNRDFVTAAALPLNYCVFSPESQTEHASLVRGFGDQRDVVPDGVLAEELCETDFAFVSLVLCEQMSGALARAAFSDDHVRAKSRHVFKAFD